MSEKESNTLEVIITNAMKLPIVKVDRAELLVQIFRKHISEDKINILIKDGPIKAGISLKTVNQEAKKLINKRTMQSTSASFTAGLPGGFAMAATIPVDTMQYFAVALRLAQELAYCYGHRDFWDAGQIDDDAVKNELILFLGVMFGVSGAAAGLRVIAANVADQALRKLPQKALAKGIYYPIIKKVCQLVGVKVTKATFAKSVSKIIPFVGGVVSGGLTYVSMKPMGKRLQSTLEETVNYTQADYERDIKDVTADVEDYMEGDFVEVNEETTQQEKSFSVADELLKLKQLVDMGVLTEEEFDKKKEELLATSY